MKKKEKIIGKNHNHNDYLKILKIFFILIILITLVYLTFNVIKPLNQKFDSPVAVVNGITIFNSEIESLLLKFNIEDRAKINRDFLLNESINQIFLNEIINENNITISDDVYEEYYNNFLIENEFNESNIYEYLKFYDINPEDFEFKLKEKIAKEIAIDEYIVKDVFISDEEVFKFYNENYELFNDLPYEVIKKELENNLLTIAKFQKYKDYMMMRHNEANIISFKFKDPCNPKKILFYDENTELVKHLDQKVIFVKVMNRDLITYCLDNENIKYPIIYCNKDIYKIEKSDDINKYISICG